MFRALLMRILYGIISSIVFLGESILFFLNTSFRALLGVITRVSSFFFIATAHWLWQLVKGKNKTTRIFSVNYYLLWYRIRYFLFGAVATLIVVSFFSAVEFINNLPNLSLLEKYNSGLSTHLYDRNGKLLYEIFREENRTPISLSSLPKYVTYATIAIEDKEFYRHQGVSLVSGVLRAVRENLFHTNGNVLQGGSTITQQLVKSALLSPERTIARKTKEVILALMVEHKYSKDQILELYLNQVPYGGTAWGIEEASKLYFGKRANELTLPEAALLAGLPQAPSLYSPYINPEGAIARQHEVLRRMYEDRYITRQQYDTARATQLSFEAPTSKILAPHFVFYVKSLLEAEYGQRRVQEGGLRVYTTLDYDLQQEAQKILTNELEQLTGYQVGNGGILITRPSTGEILAMVGSRDFFAGVYGAYNVTTALRQPGSSIKPLTYTLALKEGMTAATLLNDAPTKFETAGAAPYIPVNYDGKYHGLVSLRYALANSYNIPAVLLLRQVGVEDFVNFAEKLGISNWKKEKDRFGLSLTLGGGEVQMIDFATAYGTLRNLGMRQDLHPIKKIENSVGVTLFEESSQGIRVMREEEPFIVSDMLADNVARSAAFGTNSPLNFIDTYVSVKTGTTDEKRDNWTIGYTRPTINSSVPDILVMVWVGNNDNTPMNPALTSGITGAAPIWRRVMEISVNRKLFQEQLYIPEGIVSKQCYFGRTEYFVAGTEQSTNCQGLRPSPMPTK